MKIDTNALIMAQILGGGGSSVTVEPLPVTANGEYTAPSGKAYSPVTVNVAKPDYLISDGDNVSTFYFNTAYALGTWLATLTYSDLDPDTGLYVCYTGLGYFFGVDLTSGQYALVWNDGVNIVPIYVTIAVPAFGVTEAGWQMASYTPSVATTVVEAQIIPALWEVIDEIVAKDDIAFGIELPQLNAPTISVSQNTLSITNPSTNGNFVDGYDVYADGVKIGTTASTSYDLSGLSAHTATITAKAKSTDFKDSADSNSATFNHYYTVTMYDDDKTTVLQTELVKYGQLPTYSPTKQGYAFDYWTDVNGSRVYAISGEVNLYAHWSLDVVILAGNYELNTSNTSTYGTMQLSTTTAVITAYYGSGNSGKGTQGTAYGLKVQYISGSKYEIYLLNADGTTKPSQYIAETNSNGKWAYVNTHRPLLVISQDCSVSQTEKTKFDQFFIPA